MTDEVPAPSSGMKRSRGRPAEKGDVAASLGTPPHRRHVTVKPSSYQPSKAELEADVSVKATPKRLRDAVMRSVVVRESDDA